MAQDAPAPPTIEDMLARLGPPRNLAESLVMDRIRADLADEQRAMAGGRFAFAAWSSALARSSAIESFRLYAGLPPNKKR